MRSEKCQGARNDGKEREPRDGSCEGREYNDGRDASMPAEGKEMMRRRTDRNPKRSQKTE
jgi:hypothetical protein